MYKIASLETGDFKLIESVAKTMKPMIVSTGATEWAEISELLNLIASTGNSKIILLLCTSAYPAHPIDLNLLRLQNLKNHFEISVGLSDHTLGIGVSVAAIALGASVIEKHFTISRSDGGLDSAFSLEPLEFRTLVNEGKMAFDSLGNPSWQISKSEIFSRNLRRSLYIIKDVKAGELATEGNIRAIRPNGGCEPKYLKQILGRKFVKDFQKGTPLNLDHLS
jgi:N-acetylneuraminate synthase